MKEIRNLVCCYELGSACGPDETLVLAEHIVLVR